MNEQFVIRILNDCITPALQKVALTFSVNTTEFYDVVHECEYSFSSLLDPDKAEYSRVEEVNRSSKRLHRLLEVLLDAPIDSSSTNPSAIFFLAKVFDSKLERSMLRAYNNTATLFEIPRAYVQSDFARAGISEVAAHDLKFLTESGYFLDLATLQRDAFSFPEYIVFSSLYLAVQGPTLKVLNKPFCTPKQKSATKKRFRAISDVLFSKQLFNASVRTIFNIMHTCIAEKLNETVDQHCREFWLNDKYKNLKNFDYAMKKHRLPTPTIPQIADSYTKAILSYFENIDSEYAAQLRTLVGENSSLWLLDNEESVCAADAADPDVVTLLKFSAQQDMLCIYDGFCTTVLPVAEGIVLGYVPEAEIPRQTDFDILPYLRKSKLDSRIKARIEANSELIIDAYEYQAALLLANVVRKYFEEAQRAAAELLSCLPESTIAGEQSFFDYLQQLNY